MRQSSRLLTEWPRKAERQAFIDRIKGAERECNVITAAITHFTQVVEEKRVGLPFQTSPRDLVTAVENVESTYLIRMWAEFETALRSYRRKFTGNADDRISAIDLVNWTAGVRQGRAIAATTRDEVHEVCEYRNCLVHERDDMDLPEPIAISLARNRLNTLLHCLPIYL